MQTHVRQKNSKNDFLSTMSIEDSGENEHEVSCFCNFSMRIYAPNESTTTSKNNKSPKSNNPDHVLSKTEKNESLTEKL
jgi:hypothetical protein